MTTYIIRVQLEENQSPSFFRNLKASRSKYWYNAPSTLLIYTQNPKSCKQFKTLAEAQARCATLQADYPKLILTVAEKAG